VRKEVKKAEALKMLQRKAFELKVGASLYHARQPPQRAPSTDSHLTPTGRPRPAHPGCSAPLGQQGRGGRAGRQAGPGGLVTGLCSDREVCASPSTQAPGSVRFQMHSSVLVHAGTSLCWSGPAYPESWWTSCAARPPPTTCRGRCVRMPDLGLYAHPTCRSITKKTYLLKRWFIATSSGAQVVHPRDEHRVP
jgi:hypothetical protein